MLLFEKLNNKRKIIFNQNLIYIYEKNSNRGSAHVMFA